MKVLLLHGVFWPTTTNFRIGDHHQLPYLGVSRSSIQCRPRYLGCIWANTMHSRQAKIDMGAPNDECLTVSGTKIHLHPNHSSQANTGIHITSAFFHLKKTHWIFCDFPARVSTAVSFAENMWEGVYTVYVYTVCAGVAGWLRKCPYASREANIWLQQCKGMK